MKLQKTIFSLGIAVVLALFINVAFSVAYEKPMYPDQSKCYGIDGKAIPVQTQSQCDAEMQAFEDASNKYSIVFFIFSLVSGIALLVLGLNVGFDESISWGLMFSGLFQLVFGTVQYWGELNKTVRLVLLGAALIVLFFVGNKAIWNRR